MLLVSKADASAFSLEVYPPIIQIKAVAPVTLQTPIVVRNTADQAETLDISFKPFTQSEEQNGQIRYLKDEELNLKDPLMMQRIKILDADTEVSKVEIGPKQQKELKLQINVPDNETESDYYFSIVFTSTPIESGLKNKSDILMAVATNVLLSIGTGEKAKVYLEEFSTPFFQKEGPVEFRIRASNQGEHFASVRGYILITDLFGQTVGRIDIDPTNLLSGTTRYLSSDATSSKSTWPEIFLLGPYTADLNLQIGNNGTIIKQTTRFAGAPIQILLIILISISILLVIKYRLKRRLNR